MTLFLPLTVVRSLNIKDTRVLLQTINSFQRPKLRRGRVTYDFGWTR